jgi:hypothetical protein
VNWSLSRIWLYMYAGSLTCARTDGRCVSSGGGRRGYRILEHPLAAPRLSHICGFTAHVGGRTPSRVHNWVSPHTFSHFNMAVSQLSVCMCSILGGRYSCSLPRCLRVTVNLKQDHTVQRRSCGRVPSASPGGRAYMTTGNRPASGAPL